MRESMALTGTKWYAYSPYREDDKVLFHLNR